MHCIYLLLGSNLGNRLQQFADAEVQIVQKIGVPKKSSSVYETPPWGYTDQPAFLNKIMEVHTALSPHELLKNILEIESELGRIRTEKWHERIIDIDILFYDDEIINEPGLKIPHPHLHERRFTLVPLNEIAPGFFHPVLKKKVSRLLKDCEDHSLLNIIVS